MIDFFVNAVCNLAMDQKNSDKKLIIDLGGPSKVAKLLGYIKAGGQQRVQNWLTRGIPAQVKVDRPDLFMPNMTRLKEVSADTNLAAEQQVSAGMVLIPNRRMETEQRRAADRERDICQAGKGG